MRVLYAMTCEHASARPDGRMDVEGVFHELYAPAFPAQQDRMVVAAVIEWSETEIGRRDFRIDLADPAGTPVLTISGHSEVAVVPGESPPRTRLVMPLEEVVFPVAGTYMLRLFVDEHTVDLTPLHLLENPEA